jgi:hypothetical protein
MDTSKPITPERVLAASDAELDTLSTRHALALYRSFSLTCGHQHREHERGWLDSVDARWYNAALRLKALLDRRPHVPNKQAAKAARQAAAKRGR